VALIDDLIAFWELDEASGDALDAHGSLHLTETSGAIGAAAGKVGGCRDFEADDTEYFEIADSEEVSFGDDPLSLSLWVNFEVVSGFSFVAGQWNWGGGTGNAYVLWRNGTSLNFTVSHDGAGLSATVSQSVSAGVWYFVDVWHDPAANQIGMSLNAGAATTASHSTGIHDSSRPFALGGSVGAASAYLDGLLDQVGLWGRVKTDDERTDLYNGGNGRSYSYLSGGLVVPDHTLHFGQEF
jgi:hypothetical protein